ncbi:hypothetical protein FSARC_10985 [Fusarium sarcochroum]|uniref:Uncharacterized protein n=1 Tax=Fusarium sarcochroum TaxID=1208366 RepID=A0A8H4TIL1_9HYPO|nr:hypothetical protein FSARC_10985 [Fusarium sarcochroum]
MQISDMFPQYVAHLKWLQLGINLMQLPPPPDLIVLQSHQVSEKIEIYHKSSLIAPPSLVEVRPPALKLYNGTAQRGPGKAVCIGHLRVYLD